MNSIGGFLPCNYLSYRKTGNKFLSENNHEFVAMKYAFSKVHGFPCKMNNVECGLSNANRMSAICFVRTCIDTFYIRFVIRPSRTSCHLSFAAIANLASGLAGGRRAPLTVSCL